MLTTEVINDTDGKYVLKEGNGGIYRKLAELEGNGGNYSIEFDPNATYREYWVGAGVELTDQSIIDQTTITSDDFAEHSKIVVRKSSTLGKAEVRMIKRGGERDWTEVLNKTGYECDITKFNVAAGDYVVIGKLKENGGRYFIFSDDGEHAKKFSKHKVLKPSAVPENSVEIDSTDCVANEQIIIKEVDLSGKLGKQFMARAATKTSKIKKSFGF